MIVDERRRFEIVMVAEMDVDPILFQMGTPLTLLKDDAFEARRIVAKHTTVHQILLLREQPQIIPRVVEAIVIDVIDDQVRWCLHDESVHGDDDFLSVDRITSNGVALGTKPPFPVGQPIEVSVIDEREVILGQGNSLRHDCLPCGDLKRGWNWGEALVESKKT